jgi:hypothetical protein
MTPCQVCAIPLRRHECCPSPACPCYGLAPGTAEADQAAQRWRSRPSVAQARTMRGEDALDHLDRMSWLEYQRARGELLDVEIVHLEMP